MTPFTPEQKAELRAAIDKSKREALAWSQKRKDSRPPKSPVVRAAEHAERAQQAKTIAGEIVGAPTTPGDHCQICGAPAKGGLCHAHTDLEGTL